MSSTRGGRLLTLLTLALLSPSCCLVTIPVKTAGTVVGSTAKVAEKTAVTSVHVAGKTAVTGVDVAGKAAGAVIEGRIPTTKTSVWQAFR